MNRTLPPLGIQQRHSVAEVTPAAPRYLDLFTATKQRGTYLEDMLMEVPTKRVSMAALDQQFESEATLTENVVEFVAEAEGTDPLNLPPYTRPLIRITWTPSSAREPRAVSCSITVATGSLSIATGRSNSSTPSCSHSEHASGLLPLPYSSHLIEKP